MGYPGEGWWWSERLDLVSHAKGIITKYTPHELNHSTERGLNSRQLQRGQTTSLRMGKTYVGQKIYFHGREGLLSTNTTSTDPSKEAGDVQTTPFYKLKQKSQECLHSIRNGTRSRIVVRKKLNHLMFESIQTRDFL